MNELSSDKLHKLYTQRNNVLTEIYTTEQSYCSSLDLLCSTYYTAFKSICNEPKRAILDSYECDIVFSNIEQIRDTSRQLLADLQLMCLQRIDRTTNNNTATHIGTLFTHYSHYFKMYCEYARRCTIGMKTLNKYLLQPNNPIHLYFTQIREQFRSKHIDGTIQLLDLSAYLIMPIQRIPRYEMLLNELLRNTPVTHIDYNEINSALHAVKKIALDVNQAEIDEEARQYLLELNELFGGTIELITPSRRFIKQGKLIKHSLVHTDRIKQYEFILFNDLLVYASRNILTNTLTCHRQIAVDHQFTVQVQTQHDTTTELLIRSFSKNLCVYVPSEDVLAWVTAFGTAEQAYKQSVRSRHNSINEPNNNNTSSNHSLQPFKPTTVKPVCACCNKQFQRPFRGEKQCRQCNNKVCSSCTQHKILLSSVNKMGHACNTCYTTYKRQQQQIHTKPSISASKQSDNEQQSIIIHYTTQPAATTSPAARNTPAKHCDNIVGLPPLRLSNAHRQRSTSQSKSNMNGRKLNRSPRNNNDTTSSNECKHKSATSTNELPDVTNINSNSELPPIVRSNVQSETARKPVLHDTTNIVPPSPVLPLTPQRPARPLVRIPQITSNAVIAPVKDTVLKTSNNVSSLRSRFEQR